MFVRAFISFALLAVSGMASASFEMVIFADSTGKIHRYDPENNVYLGAISNFQVTSANSMAVDQSRNRVYVGQGNRVHTFDYNTGGYFGSYQATAGSIVHMSVGGSGNVLVTGISPVATLRTFVYSPLGTYLLPLDAIAGDAVIGAVENPAGGYITISRAGSDYYKNTNASSGALSISENFHIGVGAGNLYTGVGMMGSNLFAWGQNGAAINSGLSRNVAFPVGSIVNSPGGTVNAGETTSNSGGLLHSGTFVSVTSTTSGGFTDLRFLYRSSTTSSVASSQIFMSLTGSRTIVGTGTVIAPEPGSLIMISIGLAGLAKRRKRSA